MNTWNTSPLGEKSDSTTALMTSDKSKWLSVASCFYCNLVAGMTVALQAPFFPKESSRRGVSASTYGFVFGFYDLVLFLVSVPVGLAINRIGVKCYFIIGVLTLSSTTITFGFLSYVSDSTSFIVGAFLIRGVEAIGSAFINNACLFVTSTVMPEKSSTLTAWAQTAFGLGISLGPTLGGVLYDVGGFAFPFQIVGGLSLIGLFPVLLIIPSTTHSPDKETTEDINVWNVLMEPRMYCGIVATVLGSIASIGFISVALEPHVREINTSGTHAGLAFLVYGFSYTSLMPLWGKLLDKNVSPIQLIIAGSSIMIIGLAISGPFPWFPAPPTLSNILIGVIFVGAGQGGVFMSALQHMMMVLFSLGYQNGDEVAGVVSGIWFGSFSLGGFIGPIMGGILYDIFEYRIASFFMIILHFVVIGVVQVFQIAYTKVTP